MSFERILVTTDFSDAANAALEVARDLAQRYDAHLTLLYVQEGQRSRADGVLPRASHRGPVDLRPELKKRLAELAKTQGVVPDDIVVLVDASPVEGILDRVQQSNIDLIVIATQGRSSLQRLLIGSVTERIVRHAPCAVLTVKA